MKDPKRHLQDALTRVRDGDPDIEAVINRGTTFRTRRRLASGASTLMTVAVLGFAIVQFGPSSLRAPVSPWTEDGGLRPENDEPDEQDKEYRDPERGFTITYPATWFRAEASLTPNLANPEELFSVATFQLQYRESDCAQLPKGALESMSASDVFVSVHERYHAGASTEFTPRLPDFSVEREGKGATLECIPESLETHWIPFEDVGRRFYALVIFGGSAPSDAIDDAWSILNGARFDPR
ncbi:MAG TPA: hypothetical protein VNC78_02065 [Actinomycetota bacterium]|nr:hypothetical protein [Actinomycetota bacterium]